MTGTPTHNIKEPARSTARGALLRMVIALVVVLFAVGSGGAQADAERGHGVSVWALSGTDIVTEPGQIVSVSFRIEGQGEKETRFIDRLELPEGWQLITPTGPLDVPIGGNLTRLVGFAIPSNTPAGVYELSYGVQGQSRPDFQDIQPIRVEVQRLAQLELLTLEAPGFTVSGETATARLQLINKGNGPSRITLKAESPDGVRVRLNPERVELPIGGQETVTVEVDTPRDSRRAQQYVIKLTAQDRDDGDAARAVIIIESIPRSDARPKLYRSIPTELSIAAMGEGEKTGYQAQWSGTGFVDAKQTRSVDFMLRGPDTADITTAFGRREEYRLRYQGPTSQILVGDHSYRLSWLTEAANYGRGLGFTASPGPTTFGLYHAAARFGQEKGAQLGAHAGLDVEGVALLRFNALLSEEIAMDFSTFGDAIYSVEGELRPGTDHRIRGEVARSSHLETEGATGHALRLQAQGKASTRFSYDLQKVRASSGYTGYFTDTDLTRAMATYTLHEGLRLRATFRSDLDNIDKDPSQGSAMRLRSFDFAAVCATQDGLCFDGGNHASLSVDTLGLRASSWEDFLSGRAIYTSQALRMSVQGTGGARGDDQGLSAILRLTAMGAIEASPGRAVAVTGRMAYDSRDDASPLKSTRSITVQGRWQLIEPVGVDLQYRLTGTETFNSQLQAGLRWQPTHKWELMAAGRYESPRAGTDALWAAQVRLSRSLELPVAPRTDVGAVRGKLVDTSVAGAPGLGGVIVRAGGAVAVTDDQGRFTLHGLPPGTHHIYVDNQTLGAERILVGGQGIPVDVSGGRVSRLQVNTERGAEVRGEVLLTAEVAGSIYGAQAELYLAGPAAQTNEDIISVTGVVVELSNGVDTIRRVTDDKGRFLIQGIRPGTWTLTLVESTLPQHHRADTPQRQLNLEAGIEEAVLIAVRPQMRRVQMMETGAPKTLTLE